MGPDSLNKKLQEFASKQRFTSKGPLCVALVVTDHARKLGLPLDPANLITDGGGQVLGLGKSSVQSILKRHGIDRELAREGGRTSRGSLSNMRKYVDFLNQEVTEENLDTVEDFWIRKVKAFFAAHPFKIRLDPSRGLRSVIRDLVEQAIDRQKQSTGTSYAGALIRHLVGAKLECALPETKLEHFSYSTSDLQSGRQGDFLLGQVAIHVTTAPGEALVSRCKDNLDSGYRPIIVSLERGVMVAQELANQQSIAERVDLFEIEQFIALNLYEFGRFETDQCKIAIDELIDRYNSIIDSIETDPSLKIQLVK